MPEAQPATAVLLLGNPNVGKTTLFNRLCGLRSATANFPGSTVEARVGKSNSSNGTRSFTDLPGIYSLNADDDLSQVCRRALDGEDCESPEAVVVIADATNLRRNLFIVNEILQHGVPCVVALSMVDIAQKSGLTIDVNKLGRNLGCKVVAIHPRSGAGLSDLHTALDSPKSQQVELPDVEHPSAVNAWANEIVASSVGGTLATGTLTDRLDKAFTHPILGLVVFAVIMSGLFWTIFTLSAFPMDLVEMIFGHVGTFVGNILPAGDLHDMIVDGVIGGIAGTVVFLPQICLLFFLISLLEDTGYLARAAFVMDRLLRKFGLPGQSFVPFLSAHACAIPAIMAARIVPDKRDRFATILVAPFFSCSARLPVYVLLVGILFIDSPFLAGLAFFGCYVLGALAALFTALIVRKTVIPGKSRPMMLELPTYKLPSLRTALLNTIDRAWVFLKNAGTVILAIVIVLWWLSAYPKITTPDSVIALRTQAESIALSNQDASAELLAEADSEEYTHQLSNSYAGSIGKFIQPVFAPLGYDWKLTVGVMTSFAAREVFVSTLAVLTAGDDDPENVGVLEKIENARRDNGMPIFNLPTVASLLVFFVLAMQCLPTIAVTKRETGSWNWALLQLGYMTVLAWVASFITFTVVSGVTS
ncbi:MAG: ferrous iron transporter B [Phycisphaerae bacterium]|nr:ferrous iron transporter B [Phycisphaerae bacterium]MBT5409541.1 ferrous iron transporter B [Phycisphaerae bacterium]